MADISASVVMKLRKMSGQGMMDCKKALAETGGDLDSALELLRKKGMATMAKRADRETTEGKIIFVKTPDAKCGSMATLCCETDFVSKSDDFIAAAKKLEEYLPACTAAEGAEELAKTEVGGKPFSEVITDTVSKTGEKMELGDYTRYEVAGNGLVAAYVHFNNKLGAMIEVETGDQDAAGKLESIATDICMHITAMNPVAADRDSVDPDTIAKERELAKEQVKGKPENIIDKIVDGKMNKFFQENCLVDQDFVKEDSKTVGQALDVAAKEAGTTAKIKRFIRFEIG